MKNRIAWRPLRVSFAYHRHPLVLVARWQCQKSWASIRTKLDRERSWWRASRTAKQASCIEHHYSDASLEPRYESATPQVAVSHASFILQVGNGIFGTKFSENFVKLNLSFNLLMNLLGRSEKKHAFKWNINISVFYTTFLAKFFFAYNIFFLIHRRGLGL